LAQARDIQILRKFDKDILQLNLIQEFKDSMEIVQTVYSAPFPVAGREALVLRAGKKQEDGVYISVNSSINDARVPDTTGYVRAAVSVAGWIITPIEDGTKSHCIRIAQIDPRGWIPPFLTNLFKRKTAEGLLDIQKLIATGQIV